MPQLALKIDVDTYRGTLIGVPRLVETLRRFGAQATFLFSLGPDHTGRAIKRIFRPGFMKKVSRTSVVSHYGFRTLMYGTLLPGPDIGRRCAAILRGVRDSGYEVGIHCWDHVAWQDQVSKADMAWTEAEMKKAVDRFRQVFGDEPRTHGAAGWQMNPHALRLTQRLGLSHASDCRGTRPFIPVWNGEVVQCPQLPTTLPTLDELIGADGVNESNVHERLLELTREPTANGHVFTLHAELEGMKLMPVFDRLLAGWKAQGYELVSLNAVRNSLDPAKLPRHEVRLGEIPGRSGTLLLQGPEFLAPWANAA
ncbi:polysaccharide deacetylase family protein [Denitratisoma oestradiolicum]|uniref:Putative 4-deoxy-4-formamido-L-arabinose-phosphoundecaprenol deformylase ArnD n=1 Tax=Denitratisoma oestradiolicum TaxID=311182 RepID=A0A6S6XYJ3_9PROT|nr:polysaccharide deacetylase family protein [Denitratisoma oestradiolicum]TWO82278.1 4-deoxy-4-formamido-L-arabinose-phosphoundecaprenol deformylase [Denitratisoma oestradiolicum]CAB1369231.1 putative 4-deoxy-4-formamido-L-arabinose-phosphoundecaprenol deformylase ArnD [Denitratisoma oestradiolicum]